MHITYTPYTPHSHSGRIHTLTHMSHVYTHTLTHTHTHFLYGHFEVYLFTSYHNLLVNDQFLCSLSDKVYSPKGEAAPEVPLTSDDVEMEKNVAYATVEYDTTPRTIYSNL